MSAKRLSKTDLKRKSKKTKLNEKKLEKVAGGSEYVGEYRTPRSDQAVGVDRSGGPEYYGQYRSPRGGAPSPTTGSVAPSSPSKKIKK